MAAVSVIIPVYKAELFFEKCLRALFEQTLSDIEYIFINDATPDNSMALLDKVLSEYPERKKSVRIVTNETNLGTGATRNIGMRLATGEYVIHCDSDDWCEPDMYEQMYDVAVREKADIVCCNVRMEYTGYSVCNKYQYAIETHRELLALNLSLLYSSLWNKLIRRRLYVENGVYFFDDVNMWEDVGLITRLRYLSKKTVVIEKEFYHYNKQNEQSVVSVPKTCKIEEQMRCALLLEQFFRDKKEFALVADYLKFISKSSFLYAKPVRDVRRWKNTFPETHRSIWRYASLSREMRLEFWLASKGFAQLVSKMIDMKVYLSSKLQRA